MSDETSAERIRTGKAWDEFCETLKVASNIAANHPGVLYALAKPMIRCLFPSAARAARTCLRVATDPALESSSGGYRRSEKRRERPLKNPAPEFSARLWRESVRLTGVDFRPEELRADVQP
jgi:hypothetical protein